MIPNEKELIDFIDRRDLVNLSMIAKHFDIKNTTASDLVYSMQKKGLLIIKKLGGSKIIRVKKRD